MTVEDIADEAERIRAPVVAATAKEAKYIAEPEVRKKERSSILPDLGGEACGEWRPDLLVGRCFGLQKQKGDFPSAASCGDRCCELGDDCFTWQWRPDKGCF